MNEEFKALLAAYNATHSEWMGAMGLHNAVHQHLGSVGQRAVEAYLGQLQAAHDVATAALDAYMNRPTGFEAGYEQQQPTTRHLQAA